MLQFVLKTKNNSCNELNRILEYYILLILYIRITGPVFLGTSVLRGTCSWTDVFRGTCGWTDVWLALWG